MPAAAALGAQPAPAAPAAQANAHDRLFQLFKDSDEAYCGAIRCRRWRAATIVMPTASATFTATLTTRARKLRRSTTLRRLHAIPRGELNADDQLAYDVFEYQTKDTLRSLQPDLLPLTEALPMNHFYGLHTQYPTFSSGQGGAPYATVADYENGLKRNRDFATNVDEAIAQWRKGEAEGVVDTKLTVRNMIEQLDNQLKLKPEDSPYWGPVKAFPKEMSAADRARLTEAYRDVDQHGDLSGAAAAARLPRQRLSRPCARRASASCT